MDKCRYCNFSFTNKEDLRLHLNNEHSDVNYKDRHKYFQSLFTFNKSQKVIKKLANAKRRPKANGRSKYRFKFDKKYRGDLIQGRCKCDNCAIVFDQIWIFKNTNISEEIRICKQCELGINKRNQKMGYVKIIYTSFESKR